MKRAIVLIIDSFGIGAAPGAGKFGSEGSDILDNIASQCYLGVANDDVLIFTTDQGCDLTEKGAEHIRERVPEFVYGSNVEPIYLSDRATWADIGQSLARYFWVTPIGCSFISKGLEVQ